LLGLLVLDRSIVGLVVLVLSMVGLVVRDRSMVGRTVLPLGRVTRGTVAATVVCGAAGGIIGAVVVAA